MKVKTERRDDRESRLPTPPTSSSGIPSLVDTQDEGKPSDSPIGSSSNDKKPAEAQSSSPSSSQHSHGNPPMPPGTIPSSNLPEHGAWYGFPHYPPREYYHGPPTRQVGQSFDSSSPTSMMMGQASSPPFPFPSGQPYGYSIYGTGPDHSGHHFYHSTVWPPPPPSSMPLMYDHRHRPAPEFVYDISPKDVLCGRGGATNSHSGNKAFRSLVKKNQDKYLKAKKKDKPSVAAIIVEGIRERGGRFLRRCDHTAPDGHVLYVDIGNSRAIEKTCQALREKAPELLAKKKRRLKQKHDSSSSTASFSGDDEDSEETRKTNQMKPRGDVEKSHPSSEEEVPPGTVTTSKSQFGGVSDAGRAIHFKPEGHHRFHQALVSKGVRQHQVAKKRVVHSAPTLGTSSSLSYTSPSSTSVFSHEKCGPTMIRPIMKLLPTRPWARTPFPIDQLDSRDREMYLRDFLPPCPSSEIHPRPTQRREYVLQANTYKPELTDGLATTKHPPDSTAAKLSGNHPVEIVSV